jgi:uncharacterized membrane protein YqjE
MESSSTTGGTPPLTNSAKRLAHRVFVICENRLQLLMVEAQEERERILSAIMVAMVAAAFSLLTGITITIIVAVAFWDHDPLIALTILAAIYAVVAVSLCVKLVQFQRDWQTLPTTIEQLKKDRECLEKYLA